jgi:hypothetical protein
LGAGSGGVMRRLHIFKHWDSRDGQAGNRQDQARQHSRHGLLLCDQKNPRNQTEKMSFRKYDPVARKHVEFKEAKIK